jgi:hypothetical protein
MRKHRSPMLTHRRSHTHARIRPRRTWPDPLHGFTTRFTMSENRKQRTENRPDDRPFVPSANSKRQVSETGDRLSRSSDRSWARSDDLENQNPPATVGPLSSVPCRRILACLVGLGRLERPTSRLSGVRSNQLSYRPALRSQRSEIGDQNEELGNACRARPSDLRSPTSDLRPGRDAWTAAGAASRRCRSRMPGTERLRVSDL